MIDFRVYSVPTLLKMASEAGLISEYEVFDWYVVIAVDETRQTVSHETARGFLGSILTEWWEQQRKSEPPMPLP